MNNNSNGGSFNSFLLGLIIGGGAVFLLGTKRGKELVKTITEGGLEISDLFSNDEEDLEIPEKKENCDRCQHKKPVTTETQKETETQKPDKNDNGKLSDSKDFNDSVVAREKTNGQTLEKIVSAPKRFFRGIPKRN